MAWTPVTQPLSAWTTERQGAEIRVFSPAVFSRAAFGGLSVFAIGSPAGVWSADAAPASIWTRE